MSDKNNDFKNTEKNHSQEEETTEYKNGDHASNEKQQVDDNQQGEQQAEQQNDQQREAAAEEYSAYSEDELKKMLAEKDEIIQKLDDELKEQQETVLRKTAELDNVKKRSQKERLQYAENAKIEALEKFLPLREDLQRSLEAAEQVEVDKSFLEGVQLVSEKFGKILEEYGVEPIEEVMVPFDVDVHDAMMKQPAQDKNVDSNTVLNVVETGYKVGDRVIKHAKVIVSE